jgi:hypothetical protein
VDCPWRTAWCSPKLQYYHLQFTHEELNVLIKRAAELEQFMLVEIQVPKELVNLTSPVVLVICGWKAATDHFVECIFGCSKNVVLDAQFHPLFEHRWCCPAVNLNSSATDLTGWKGILHLYRSKLNTI